ncbi:MAG: hypothetical protein RR338_03970, partial [Clostridia bacterium]
LLSKWQMSISRVIVLIQKNTYTQIVISKATNFHAKAMAGNIKQAKLKIKSIRIQGLNFTNCETT